MGKRANFFGMVTPGIYLHEHDGPETVECLYPFNFVLDYSGFLEF